MPDANLRVFERLYANAAAAGDLPWHDPEPPPLLVTALDARPRPGRALDVGCGAGTYSIYMAQRGYAVTAIDFMPQAIRLLGEARAGLDIEPVQADVLAWSAESPFDVVLDVGCLHSLQSADRATYKRRLCEWLAPGGDFVLVHCGSRGWWDRWPLGPRRVGRTEVEALFAPELTLREYREERLRLPLFLGCSALASRYWFRRTR